MTIKAKAGFRMLAAGGTADIWLYGLIGDWFDGITGKQFVDELATLGPDVTDLVVHINSPGGSVNDGQAIYNALKSHPAQVVTSIEGAAWSAASMVAQAGDLRVMHANATLMIHNPAVAAYGFAADLRQAADDLEQLEGVVREAYADRSGQSVETVAEWMAAETRFTAAEALDAGLIDEIAPNKTKQPSAPMPAINWSEKLAGAGVRDLPRVAVALAEFESQPKGTPEMTGQQIAAALNRAIDAKVTAEQPRDQVVASMAAAAGLETAALGPLLDESTEFTDAHMQAAVKLLEISLGALAPASAPAPAPAAPPTQAPAQPDMLAAERERISGITNVCEMSGIDAARRQKWIDDGTPLAAVTKAARAQMAANNPPPAADPASPGTGDDPDERFRADYRQRSASMKSQFALTEEQYIKSRRISAGLDPLVPGAAAKQAK